MERRSGRGILSGPIDGAWRQRTPPRQVDASPGLFVTHLGSRFVGEVVGSDLEAPLVGAVESLIDFVTADSRLASP